MLKKVVRNNLKNSCNLEIKGFISAHETIEYIIIDRHTKLSPKHEQGTEPVAPKNYQKTIKRRGNETLTWRTELKPQALRNMKTLTRCLDSKVDVVTEGPCIPLDPEHRRQAEVDKAQAGRETAG
jgi:hypothetical protein